MSALDRMARLFDRRAEEFDAIYSGRKGSLGRGWDRLTRSNIQRRFDFSMEAIGDVRGRRVLDVGCGSGRYCVEIARRGAAQVVGLDISARMLELGRELAERAGVGTTCRFVQGDVLHFEDEPFDAVLAMGFFDYVRDQEPVLRRMGALSRGPVVASFPTLWAWRAPARMLWWRMHGWSIHFSTHGALVQTCARAGLVPERLVRDGPIYLLVARPDQNSTEGGTSASRRSKS